MTTSIAKLQHKLAVARKSTARAREKAGELMETALETGLTGGMALALGVWSRSSPSSFKDLGFGVPAPLAIGIAAHAASMFGVGRGMEQHVRSLGNGAIAAHLFSVGQDMVAAKASAPQVSGVGPSTADLLNLARS